VNEREEKVEFSNFVKFLLPDVYRAISYLNTRLKFQRDRIDDLAKEVYDMRKTFKENTEFDDQLKKIIEKDWRVEVKVADQTVSAERSDATAERSDATAREEVKVVTADEDLKVKKCPHAIASLSDHQVENIKNSLYMSQAADPDGKRLSEYIRQIYSLAADQQLENMSEYIMQEFYVYYDMHKTTPAEYAETFTRKIATLSEFLEFFR
jgi:hypothetical protein